MRNEIINKLINNHGCPQSFAETEADRVMTALRYAPSLAANITEWVKDEPISDIFVGRWCVRNVLKVRGHEKALEHPGDLEILQAVYSILTYAANPVVGKTLIYQVRR